MKHGCEILAGLEPASRPVFNGLRRETRKVVTDREVGDRQGSGGLGQGRIRWLPGYADGRGWNGCQALKTLETLRQLGPRQVIRPNGVVAGRHGCHPRRMIFQMRHDSDGPANGLAGPSVFVGRLAERNASVTPTRSVSEDAAVGPPRSRNEAFDASPFYRLLAYAAGWCLA